MKFCEKLYYLIEKRGITKNKLLTDLNLNRNSIQNWKKQGSKPRIDTMALIAEYFNVSTDSLANDDMELEYQPYINKSNASNQISYFQRSASLCGGYLLTDEKINRFSQLLNASVIFLTNLSEEKYFPEKHSVNNRTEIDYSTMFDIFELADRCADNEPIRVIMIQISKVLLYRIKNYIKPPNYNGKTDLYNCKGLLKEKLDFLYSNKPHKNVAMNFGFNFTEITEIHNYTKMSYYYLFTGEEKESIISTI